MLGDDGLLIVGGSGEFLAFDGGVVEAVEQLH